VELAVDSIAQPAVSAAETVVEVSEAVAVEAASAAHLAFEDDSNVPSTCTCTGRSGQG
jgi:hypothetical protein